MGTSLVIVESPTKAKTLAKYLGPGYQVKASVGHVKDLPKGKLGVDLKDRFQPTYEVIATKKKVIEDLKKAASKAERIYLALDPDREGEAIAWHLAEEISKGDKKKQAKKPVHRVLFQEVTKKAVLQAIQNPKELDQHLYEAQQARRVLDRLVGYKISPLLWEKVRRGLSAGRVQSVATRLICDREREIKSFVPEEYWTIDLELEGGVPPPFRARVVSLKGEKLSVVNEAQARVVVGEIEASPPVLQKIERKEKRRHPSPPFVTSKLQQAGSRAFGFAAKRTMMIAQELYEGIELAEEGPVGLITYMRTDSTRISEDVLQEVRGLIAAQYGGDYLPSSPNYYKNRKATQDAHEAIRPTSMDHTPDKVRNSLTEDQYKLYSLIWNRFVASQMSSAVYDQTTFEMTSGDYVLRAVGSRLKFAGYLSAYGVAVEEGEEEAEQEGVLPELVPGETLKIVKPDPGQHFTEPPPRFNEASLIRELEEKGIGRPSTYASILSTIVDREYVKKDQGRLFPTDLGQIVTDLLVESFPNILNVEFTARMEEELDEVEEGRRTYAEAVQDFYLPFSETLSHAKVKMRDVKRQELPTELSCERCSSPMVIKWGRRGEFLACTNYPACKNTREFERDDNGSIRLMKREVTGEFCGECGGQMIIKTGRFGKFLACSNYPTCKKTRPLTTGISCPTCGGKVVERRTRKGRVFFGCANYPKCKFATWDRPLKEPCPVCGSPYLVVKPSKKFGDRVCCPVETCDYKKVEPT